MISASVFGGFGGTLRSIVRRIAFSCGGWRDGSESTAKEPPWLFIIFSTSARSTPGKSRRAAPNVLVRTTVNVGWTELVSGSGTFLEMDCISARNFFNLLAVKSS